MNNCIGILFSKDTWTVLSNLLAIYAIIQIFVYKFLIRRHNNKMRHFPYLISGGSSKDFELQNEAIKYSKTWGFRFIDFLKKIF